MAAAKTNAGLSVEVDPALFSDARVAFVIGRLTRSGSTPAEQASLYSEFIELVLGGYEKAMAAMDAYAEANGGRCDLADFTAWLMAEVSEAGSAGKNS